MCVCMCVMMIVPCHRSKDNEVTKSIRKVRQEDAVEKVHLLSDSANLTTDVKVSTNDVVSSTCTHTSMHAPVSDLVITCGLVPNLVT